MRASVMGAELKAAAYAGTYVVVLAWDTVDGKTPARTDLLGFAIERAELDVAGNEVERYWMRGIKRFKDKDMGLPPGTAVPTAEHPIQSFLWADYTAKAGTRYLFRIVPLYGTVKNPKLDEAAAVTLDVTAEHEGDQPLNEADESVRHDVFFNRGVIGSQAYAREFGNREPDAENPRSKEMKWLSRGLFEALVKFIGLARDGMSLRAALYEFHYQPVANAFTKAIEAGADVKIVYDAASDYKIENQATIRTARLDEYDAVIPRPSAKASATTNSSSSQQVANRARYGRDRRTSPPAASSATPTSAMSCGTKTSRRVTSSTGSGWRRISLRPSCAPRTRRPHRRRPGSRP